MRKIVCIVLSVLAVCGAATLISLGFLPNNDSAGDISGAEHVTIGVTADMAETDVTALKDNIFYRNVPEEHMAIDAESKMPYVDDEIRIYVNSKVSCDDIKALVKQYSPKLAGYDYAVDAYELCLDRPMSEAQLLTLCSELEKSPKVVSACPNYWFEASEDLEDMLTAYGSEYNKLLNNDVPDKITFKSLAKRGWGLEAINALSLWQYSYYMEDVNVAVWDCFPENPGHKELKIENSASMCGPYYNKEDHGLHVAGIIGAKHDGYGIMGVAPRSKIFAYGYLDLYGNTSRLTSTAMCNRLSSITWNDKARVVNCSWSVNKDIAASAIMGNGLAINILNNLNKQMAEHIKTLRKNPQCPDFLICVSAGNFNNEYCVKAKKFDGEFAMNIGYKWKESSLDPSKIPLRGKDGASADLFGGIEDPEVKDRIIVVGACEETQYDSHIYRATDFTAAGSRVDVYAPGRYIFSLSLNDDYEVKDGTSMATPYVSGVAACMFSIDKNITAKKVKEIITSSGSITLYDSLRNGRPMLDAQEIMAQMKRPVIGEIVDAETGEKLDTCTVDAAFDVNADILERYLTYEDGKFSLNLLKDCYEIRFEKQGYEPLTVQLTVDKNGWEDDTPIDMGTIKLSKSKVSLEDEFQKYIAETLVPKYGVMDTKVLSENVEWKRSDVTGLLSANIKDFDGDGQEELLAISYKTVQSKENAYYDETTLKLEVFEYDFDKCEVKLSDEKETEAFGGYTIKQFMLDMNCFTYQYCGTTYLAIDNNFILNETISTLDIFKYDDNKIKFERAFGYQKQGAGTVAVWQADKEPDVLTFCADSRNWENGDTWYPVMKFDADTGENEGVFEPSEGYEVYYKKYCEIVKGQGLSINDARVYCGDIWPDNTREIQLTDIYKPLEGELEWLTCLREVYDPSELYRVDCEHTLDAYRNGSTVETTTHPEIPTTAPTAEATTKGTGVNKADIYNAYLKQIKNTEQVECYTLYDIDNNGVPELILKTGDTEFTYEFKAYSYNNGIVYCDTFGGYNSTLYIPKNKKGLLCEMWKMGYANVWNIKMKNYELVIEGIFIKVPCEEIEDSFNALVEKELETYSADDLSGLNSLKG